MATPISPKTTTNKVGDEFYIWDCPVCGEANGFEESLGDGGWTQIQQECDHCDNTFTVTAERKGRKVLVTAEHGGA